MRVVVGRVGRAQGIRGEVTVEVRTDSPEERFAPGSVLHPTGRDGLPEQVQVAAHRWQGGRLILALRGVTDRDAAEALRGALLEADVALVADGEEFHDLALRGLRVLDRSGGSIGRICEILHLPGQDVLVVEDEQAKEILVPFVRDLVPEVDVPGGFVVVDLPEGLAELGDS